MNIFTGIIDAIKVQGCLSLVKVNVGPTLLSAIVIDTPETAPYLQTGQSIQAIFKETEVIIGKGDQHHISLQNKLVGQVQAIESGELLSKVTVETQVGLVTSVITTNAVRQLQLDVGTEVVAMIKTNEVMLSESVD